MILPRRADILRWRQPSHATNIARALPCARCCFTLRAVRVRSRYFSFFRYADDFYASTMPALPMMRHEEH